MIILVTLRQKSACTISTATVKVTNTLSYFFRKTITYTFPFSLKISITHACRRRSLRRDSTRYMRYAIGLERVTTSSLRSVDLRIVRWCARAENTIKKFLRRERTSVNRVSGCFSLEGYCRVTNSLNDARSVLLVAVAVGVGSDESTETRGN